jgi:hypothetical protein
MSHIANIPPPQNLEPEEWPLWKEQWCNYEIATGLNEKEDKIRVATLLAVIGKDANKLYKTFKWDNAGDEKIMEKVIGKFDEICVPKKNETYERYILNKRVQLDGETLDQFLTELRHLATHCGLASITEDKLMADKIVFGVRDVRVRERLLREKDLDLKKACDIARAAEASQAQIRNMTKEEVVCAVQKAPSATGTRNFNAAMINDCRF